MRDRDGRDYPVCPYRKRNRDYGADMDDGKPRPFYFLYDRCAATSTGASGGCDYYGVNVVIFQFLGYFGSKTLRVSNRSTVSDGCVELLV
jgi:hypothetical protein